MGDLREVLFLKGKQLGEERIGGKGTIWRRMRPGFGSGVGQPETEVLQNPLDFHVSHVTFRFWPSLPCIWAFFNSLRKELFFNSLLVLSHGFFLD